MVDAVDISYRRWSGGKVKRDVIQAAYWAGVNAGKSLEDCLKTTEGQPFANYWSAAEVQQADQHAANNPLQP